MDLQLTEDMINSMLRAAQEASKHEEKSQDHYLYKSIEDLYGMLLRCDSAGRYNEEECKRVLRVIRVKRLIPKGILHILDSRRDGSGIYDRTFCSGMYITVPVVQIPKEVLNNSCIRPCSRGYYYTTDIPEVKATGASVVESSLQLISDGSAIVLERSPLTDFIYDSRHYKMLEIY